jgi:RNA polymerase sigma-70 factor (ECF subfamily)
MTVQEVIAEESLESLVVAAQRGDREAFGQLVERFQRSVYATAYRRLNNHAEAQEVAQEVFVRALEKLQQLREPACFSGWLRSMTVRMSINRAVRRAPTIATEPETMAATFAGGETPLTTALAHERRNQVRAGLKRLGEMDRNTLLAFYVEGQSLVQMSNQFDSPVGTIKRRLHVARKRLAKELEELIAV